MNSLDHLSAIAFDLEYFKQNAEILRESYLGDKQEEAYYQGKLDAFTFALEKVNKVLAVRAAEKGGAK